VSTEREHVISTINTAISTLKAKGLIKASA
jgi:hypothetical protein